MKNNLFDYINIINYGIEITAINTIPADGHVVIPAEINGKPVTAIGEGAFSGWTSLTSVTIPDSVTEIEWNAFYGCDYLPYSVYPRYR